MNFNTIDYLKNGNAKQKHVYSILTKHSILFHLEKYDPLVVGTIPLAIDVEASDIDIICCWTDKNEFETCLKKNFNACSNFKIKDNPERGSILATFMLDNFQFEIWGQNIPTQQQLGYQHMIIEYRLLVKHGESFRSKIIRLKQQGYKTEPAFAYLLGLHGDPYEELLKIKI